MTTTKTTKDCPGTSQNSLKGLHKANNKKSKFTFHNWQPTHRNCGKFLELFQETVFQCFIAIKLFVTAGEESQSHGGERIGM